MPIYNVEKYIVKGVESLCNQNYKNIEIILVDDGSPDRSPELIDDIAQRDKRVKVIHKTNGGVSSARNVGIHHSMVITLCLLMEMIGLIRHMYHFCKYDC